MQLVEQGLIDLDRDVNEYLDFELPGSGTGIFMVYSGGDFMGHPEIFRGFINEFFPPESRAHLIDDRDAVPGTISPAPVALPNSELGGEYQPSRRIETGGDKLVNLLMMVMRVRPEGERELSVNLLGSEYRFMETAGTDPLQLLYPGCRRYDLVFLVL